MPFTPPSDLTELIELMDEIDEELPLCNDNAYQMKAYTKASDLLTPIKQGKLVVISRGMFRRLRDAIKELARFGVHKRDE